MSAVSTAHVTWCRDTLHDVLGYSDISLAEMLCSIASRAASALELQATVQSQLDLPRKPHVLSFLTTLFGKVHVDVAQGDGARTKSAMRSNADMMEQNRHFEFIEEPEVARRVEKKRKAAAATHDETLADFQSYIGTKADADDFQKKLLKKAGEKDRAGAMCT